MFINTLSKKKERNRVIMIISLAAVMLLILGYSLGYSTGAENQISKIEDHFNNNYVCYPGDSMYGKMDLIIPNLILNVTDIIKNLS